jgi:CDP-diacylglycerol--serine O-phosphatidyltransferase
MRVLMLKNKENPPGIYLLPNLLTTASLFAAFYSIVASLKGMYEIAAITIFIGMVADGLDGRIARLTNTQSAFGAQYDSLADMVTFGVAPSLLLYSWSLQQLGKVGWLVAFIYTASVALRLARFNVQLETVDKRYFQGLACPAAAAIISSFVWCCDQNNLLQPSVVIISAVLSIIISLLMISNIRYYSFKEIDFKGKVPFLSVLIILILFVAVAAAPAYVLFFASLLYALWGPCYTLLLWRKRRLWAAQRENKD